MYLLNAVPFGLGRGAQKMGSGELLSLDWSIIYIYIHTNIYIYIYIIEIIVYIISYDGLSESQATVWHVWHFQSCVFVT